jgi:beta-mannosidase
VDSINPSVSYWESSPKYGRGDKRYQFEGDAHDWWVWHDGYPFEHFEEEVPRFMSEFGFQSFPSYKTIRYFTEQDNIDLAHTSFATHQKHSRGFSLINEYMQRDFPVPSNDEAYIYVSQLLQAYGISKGIHAHRRAKPYNMGTLYWQLNDCWPVVSWSSIDGLGNWKALHYEAKRAFEDILISTSESDGALKVHLINDSFSELKDRLNITHLDFFGKVRSENNISVTSPPDSSTIVYEFLIDQTPFERNTTFLELTFGPYKSLHFFSKPKDLKLPHSKINRTIEKVAHGFSVTLQSQTLQKAVFLVSKNNGKWSDNFFDLLPNETKTIMFLTKEPTTPIIEIKTLNNLY